MNRVREFATRLRVLMDRPGYRHLPKLAATAVVLGAVILAVGLPGRLTANKQRLIEMSARLKSLQDNLGEIERLKPRPAPPMLSGAALQETVVATLAQKLPTLTATLVDANRIQIQGRCEFDAFVRWLGEVQEAHRLGLKSLVATRQDSSVTVDATLVSSDE